MITTLLLLIATSNDSGDGSPIWEPKLLDQNSFEVKSISKRSYRGEERSSRVRFWTQAYSGSLEEFRSFERVADSNAVYSHNTPSSAPLLFGYIVSNGTLTSHATDGMEISRVMLTSPMENSIRPGKTGLMPQETEFEDFLPFVERILRYQVATLKGRNSSINLPPFSILNNTFERRTDSNSGVDFVKLKDIALFLKYSVSDIIPDNPIGLKISKPDQESLEFYMATKTFRKGNQYLDMRDSTILINGELWVPTEVIDHF